MTCWWWSVGRRCPGGGGRGVASMVRVRRALPSTAAGTLNSLRQCMWRDRGDSTPAEEVMGLGARLLHFPTLTASCVAAAGFRAPEPIARRRARSWRKPGQRCSGATAAASADLLLFGLRVLRVVFSVRSWPCPLYCAVRLFRCCPGLFRRCLSGLALHLVSGIHRVVILRFSGERQGRCAVWREIRACFAL